MLDEMQVEEVGDTEHLFSRFRMFYGRPDPAKCSSCDAHHLFSQ